MNIIYGQKQAGIVWNQYLVQGLLNIGVKQSDNDKCVIFQGDVILFFYVDNGYFLIPRSKSAERSIADLKDVNR